MRISDWSSDVCSSDLLSRDGDGKGRRQLHPVGDDAAGRLSHHRHTAETDVRAAGQRRPRIHPQRRDRQDRQSVETGKRVTVRVVLGGRSKLTTKKTNEHRIRQKKNQEYKTKQT